MQEFSLPFSLCRGSVSVGVYLFGRIIGGGGVVGGGHSCVEDLQLSLSRG